MRLCHVNFNINRLHYEASNENDREIQFPSEQIQTKTIRLNASYATSNSQRQDLFENDEKAHVNFIQVESSRDDVSEKKVDDVLTTESKRMITDDDSKMK